MRAAFLLLLACSGPSKQGAATPIPAPTWDGDYQLVRVDGKSSQGYEHWVTSAGVRFGVAFDQDGFAVNMIDGDTFSAMPGGLRRIDMPQVSIAHFANDTDAITYAIAGDVLEARLVHNGGERVYSFTRIDAERAAEIESADTAFADDVSRRGIDGWVAAFEPGGAQMTKKGRVEGTESIRSLMSDTLAKGKLTWAPTTSRVHGDWGFTVGLATYAGEESWKSTYVTVWHRQPDRGWKVVFDTGAAAH